MKVKRKLKLLFAVIICIVMIWPQINVVAAKATETDEPIKIYTVDDLYAINDNMSGNYILMNDIDLTEATKAGGTYDFQGNGWKPIGANVGYGIAVAFSGVFDGNGYSIKGMHIETNTVVSAKSAEMYVGLFASNEGTIKNLNLEAVDIRWTYGKESYVGTIVGKNSGTIESCSVVVSMVNNTTDDYVYDGMYGSDKTGYKYYHHLYVYSAGVVGRNAGKITKTNCSGTINLTGYSRSSTTSSQYSSSYGVAGIAAKCDNTSDISECFNLCDVDGVKSSAYGIAINGMVTNCYNAGNITSSTYAYGISGGTNSKCYNVGKTSYYAIGGSGNNCYYLEGVAPHFTSGNTVLNSSQITNSSFYKDFDFNTIWIIDSSTAYKYPQLRNNRQDTDKEIDIVEWDSTPTKTTYMTGDEISVDGGKFTVYYMDYSDETVDVTKDMISGYDLSKAGEQTVIVTYKNQTITYNINVIERPEIVNLSLYAEPNKKEFVRGTAFDFTGARVKIEYANDTFEIAPLYEKNVSGLNIDKSGTQIATYTLYGKTMEFEVRVVPVKIVDIAVATNPNKTFYFEGEEFAIDGLTVKAIYNNGVESDVNLADVQVEGIDNSVGTHKVSLTYRNCVTSFEYRVVEKTGLAKFTDGNWYYFVDGLIATDKTGIVENASGHWYVNEGKIDFTKRGVVEDNGVEYVVHDGYMSTGFSGLTKKDDGTWAYAENGILTYSYTGLANNAAGWWFITDGVIDFKYTGIGSNATGDYRVVNGQIDFRYDGWFNANGNWWYMKGGMVDRNKAGLVKKDSSYFYVENGEINFKYTGLAENAGNTYYVKDGYLDFSFSGEVTADGKKVTVVRGMVQK